MGKKPDQYERVQVDLKVPPFNTRKTDSRGLPVVENPEREDGPKPPKQRRLG